MKRPDYGAVSAPIRAVDLFSGAGGLSLGICEAARRRGRGTDIILAVERDEAAADVYALNFPRATLRRADVRELFDGAVGANRTTGEHRLCKDLGRVDVLVSGPPCQGHSDLNNRTRRRDPRNALYLRAVRAAEVLLPTFVLIENVPAVQHDAGGVLDEAIAALQGSGYAVSGTVLNLLRFGVPQRRRRHVLLAVRDQLIDPAVVLESTSPCAKHRARTVQWAIQDLKDREGFSGLDAPAVPSAANLRRMLWLLRNNKDDLPNHLRPECHWDNHTYTSMYGRLRWDAPAQTITTGFGSMGQGRFVHPSLPRTITPHEAARLQTFPDFFDFDQTKGRGVWARVIGNAVPPLLGVHVIEPLLCSLVDEASTASNARHLRPRHGVPAASTENIRLRMATTKQRDTRPELALRVVLHRHGFRYRVDKAVDGTRRRADIVFPAERVAIYVDGCFWHGCPLHGTVPKQNRDWWIAKLRANTQRDADTDRRLRSAGWKVLRFWAHDNAAAAATRVEKAVLRRRAPRPSRE